MGGRNNNVCRRARAALPLSRKASIFIPGPVRSSSPEEARIENFTLELAYPSGDGRHKSCPDDSGDWVRPAKDLASTRFSSLDQITPQTIPQLGVKITFSTGIARRATIGNSGGLVLLWASMLAGPTAWELNLQVSYALVKRACMLVLTSAFPQIVLSPCE